MGGRWGWREAVRSRLGPRGLILDHLDAESHQRRKKHSGLFYDFPHKDSMGEKRKNEWQERAINEKKVLDFLVAQEVKASAGMLET